MTDTIRSKIELKSLFENGDIPSESDFSDLITTFASLSAEQTIEGKTTFNSETVLNGNVKVDNLSQNQVVIANNDKILTSTNSLQVNSLNSSSIETERINTISFESSAISLSSSLIFDDNGDTFLRVKKDQEPYYIQLHSNTYYTSPIEVNLRFNNINVYDVVGDTGDKNLGEDLGLQYIIMPISDYQQKLISGQDETSYYYDLELILQESYGGAVNLYTGIKVTYTYNGTNITESTFSGLSTRVNGDGNKGSNYRRFTVQIPKTVNNEIINYVRFDVICGRQGGGSTGIVGGQLRFN
jgi:hypothetical protein